MSTKRTCGVCPVAKKMWSTNINGEAFVEKKPLREWPSFSVWMLDLSTPEKYDAAVEQMARAIHKDDKNLILWSREPEDFKRFYRSFAVVALSSIGISRPRQPVSP